MYFDAFSFSEITFQPQGLNRFYVKYDSGNSNFQCYRSTGINAGDVEEYRGTGEVYISWEDFLLPQGRAISGYNIYRRLAGEEFNYNEPINRDIVGRNENSYRDNSRNSYEAPVGKMVYYYEVRPVINNVEVTTSENSSYTTARVLIPPENMSFVSRRIVNKYMCEKCTLLQLI